MTDVGEIDNNTGPRNASSIYSRPYSKFSHHKLTAPQFTDIIFHMHYATIHYAIILKYVQLYFYCVNRPVARRRKYFNEVYRLRMMSRPDYSAAWTTPQPGLLCTTSMGYRDRDVSRGCERYSATLFSI